MFTPPNHNDDRYFNINNEHPTIYVVVCMMYVGMYRMVQEAVRTYIPTFDTFFDGHYFTFTSPLFRMYYKNLSKYARMI